MLFHLIFTTTLQIEYSWPSYPLVLHPWIQPTADGKYLKKIPGIFQKQNLCCDNCIRSYKKSYDLKYIEGCA